MVPTRITPVIICGGAGTRLWPVSRESLPKQFVPLVGTTSTFHQVLERVAQADLFAPPIVITHADSRFIVAEQMRAVGVNARYHTRALPTRLLGLPLQSRLNSPCDENQIQMSSSLPPIT